MTIIVTNWQLYVHELDAYVPDENGKLAKRPIPWLYGSNAPVSIDLALALEENESITNPIVTLEYLPAIGETDYVDVSGSCLEGVPVVTGTFVSHLLKDLVRGRVYRMKVLFGATDNQRGRSQLVRCF